MTRLRTTPPSRVNAQGAGQGDMMIEADPQSKRKATTHLHCYSFRLSIYIKINLINHHNRGTACVIPAPLEGSRLAQSIPIFNRLCKL